MAIEAASAKDVQLIRDCKKFEELGLKVEFPKKVRPKMIIFVVPNEVSNDDFVDELYVKNVKNIHM